MANSDKNIVITPNKGLSGLPEISFTGVGNSSITLTIPDSSTGTLEFRSGVSTIFSVDSEYSSGDIFSVIDDSSLPVFQLRVDGSKGELETYKPVDTRGSAGIVLPRTDQYETHSSRKGNLTYNALENTVHVGVQTNIKPLLFASPSFDSPNPAIQKGLMLYLDGRINSYPETGTTWYDKSGNGHNFTFQSTPTYSKHNGGYILKDGSEPGPYNLGDNNYAYGNYAALNITRNFTQECWMRATQATTYRTMISWGVHTTQQDRSMWLESGTGRLCLYFFGTGDNMTVGARDLRDGAWHHCVATWDGTYGKVYVDGHLEGCRILTAGTFSYQGTWIGANPSTSYRFVGAIGSASIYNRDLSLSEIRANYFGSMERFHNTTPVI
jgi:hypothetical protein